MTYMLALLYKEENKVGHSMVSALGKKVVAPSKKSIIFPINWSFQLGAKGVLVE